MPTRLSPSRFMAMLAATSLIASGVPLACARSAEMRTARDIAGQWDLYRDQRHCRIVLNAEQSDKGDYFVGFPVACRHLLPALAKVGRWHAEPDGRLALTDPSGTSVLDFAADGKGFAAQGSDGAPYRLVNVPPVGRNVIAGDPDLLRTGEPRLVATAPGAGAAGDARHAMVRPGEVAGRYAVLRDRTHDTGCMLTLDDKTRVKGGARAALAPACRDQGIVIFDPTAWRIVDGRLVLVAKAGHTTHLDRQADGTWLKDPAEGKSLSLKRL